MQLSFFGGPASPFCQRWWARRHSWRHTSEGGFDRSRYDVEAIPDDRTARRFVARHHYSGSYPSARLRYGLYERGELRGVAVLSVPTNNRALTNTFPGLEPMTESPPRMSVSYSPSTVCAPAPSPGPRRPCRRGPTPARGRPPPAREAGGDRWVGRVDEDGEPRRETTAGAVDRDAHAAVRSCNWNGNPWVRGRRWHCGQKKRVPGRRRSREANATRCASGTAGATVSRARRSVVGDELHLRERWRRTCSDPVSTVASSAAGRVGSATASGTARPARHGPSLRPTTSTGVRACSAAGQAIVHAGRGPRGDGLRSAARTRVLVERSVTGSLQWAHLPEPPLEVGRLRREHAEEDLEARARPSRLTPPRRVHGRLLLDVAERHIGPPVGNRSVTHRARSPDRSARGRTRAVGLGGRAGDSRPGTPRSRRRSTRRCHSSCSGTGRR